MVLQSFRPRDAIDLMLVGQLVEFHEILADGTRELLRGMTESPSVKQRTRSSLVAIGRVCLSYIDRLEKRGLEPHRAEIVARAAEQPAAPAISPGDAGGQTQAADRSAFDGVPAISPSAPPPEADLEENRAVETQAGLTAEPSAAASSRLDATRPESVAETPADALFRTNAARISDLLREVAHRNANIAAAQPVDRPELAGAI